MGSTLSFGGGFALCSSLTSVSGRRAFGPTASSPRETCTSCFRGWRVLVWKEGRWPSCTFTRQSLGHATNVSYACMRSLYVLHSTKDAPELLRTSARRTSENYPSTHSGE